MKEKTSKTMASSFGSSLADTAKIAEARTQPNTESESSRSIDLRDELIDISAVDDVLAKKMALVNSAIDEIGMTPFQWKLFFLNGFGYAVDSVSDNRIRANQDSMSLKLCR